LSERIDIEITGEEELDRYLRKLNLIVTRGQSVGSVTTGGTIQSPVKGLDTLDPKFVAYLRSKAFAANVFSQGGMKARDLERFGQFMSMNERMIHRNAPLDAILASNLPSLSREERIIWNQIMPAGSLRTLYNVKRLQGGIAIGGYQSALAIIATGLIILQQINQLRQRLEADREEYRQVFLEYKPDLTKEEYEKLRGQSTDQWTKALNYIFRIGV
jgi:hypothetical protein